MLYVRISILYHQYLFCILQKAPMTKRPRLNFKFKRSASAQISRISVFESWSLDELLKTYVWANCYFNNCYLLQSTIINLNNLFELPRRKELVLYWSIAATKSWAKHISFTKPIFRVFESFQKFHLTKGLTDRPTNGQSHMHAICILVTETSTVDFDMLS